MRYASPPASASSSEPRHEAANPLSSVVVEKILPVPPAPATPAPPSSSSSSPAKDEGRSSTRSHSLKSTSRRGGAQSQEGSTGEPQSRGGACGDSVGSSEPPTEPVHPLLAHPFSPLRDGGSPEHEWGCALDWLLDGEGCGEGTEGRSEPPSSHRPATGTLDAAPVERHQGSPPPHRLSPGPPPASADPAQDEGGDASGTPREDWRLALPRCGPPGTPLARTEVEPPIPCSAAEVPAAAALPSQPSPPAPLLLDDARAGAQPALDWGAAEQGLSDEGAAEQGLLADVFYLPQHAAAAASPRPSAAAEGPRGEAWALTPGSTGSAVQSRSRGGEALDEGAPAAVPEAWGGTRLARHLFDDEEGAYVAPLPRASPLRGRSIGRGPAASPSQAPPPLTVTRTVSHARLPLRGPSSTLQSPPPLARAASWQAGPHGSSVRRGPAPLLPVLARLGGGPQAAPGAGAAVASRFYAGPEAAGLLDLLEDVEADLAQSLAPDRPHGHPGPRRGGQSLPVAAPTPRRLHAPIDDQEGIGVLSDYLT